jgi:hypothetical protein
MSIAIVRDLAKQAAGAFVQLPGQVLADALVESGATAEPGSLLEHVRQRLSVNPDCVMQVHRDVHLGPILRRVEAVNEPFAPTPSSSTLET